MKWIKASERTPDFDVVTLVHLRFSTDNTKFKLTGFYKDGRWYRQSGDDNLLDWAPNLEWLDESETPLPATEEQITKAAYLRYPEADGKEISEWSNAQIVDLERSAHITAARQYMGEIERLRELATAYEQYAKLLGDELDEVIGFVNVHQWKSTRHEQGKEMREKIAALKTNTHG